VHKRYKLSLKAGLNMSKAGVFVREATGLVKSISPSTMFFANLGEIGFGTTLLTLNIANSFYGGNPGGNATLATLIFTVFILFEAYIYFEVIRRVGRTGGDYVWISRTISPVLGAFLILGFTFTGIPFIAIQLNWLLTLSLGPALSTIGVVTANSGLTSLASTLTSPAPAIAVGAVLLLLITLVDILSPRNGFRMLAAFVALGLVGTFMMAAVFLVSGPSGVQSSLSTFLSQNGSSYSALSNYTGPFASWGAMVLLFPYLAFALPWINNAAAWSGELKNLRRSAFTGTFMAVVISGLLLSSFLALYSFGVGFKFAMAAPTLWPSSLSTQGLQPNMLAVAEIVLRGAPTVALIMGILFSFWYLAACQQTILAISRYLFGMSFDRLLPAKVASVSEKFHSPIAALLVPIIVSLPFFAVVEFTSFTSEFSTTALGTLYFAFMGLTAIVYAVRKRNELGKAYAAMVVSGIVVLGFFGFLTYMFLVPNYGLDNPFSFSVMIFFWVMGALLYPISKAYHSRKGVDITLVFKELPPE
jgi:amino acid transporter